MSSNNVEEVICVLGNERFPQQYWWELDSLKLCRG